jgi:hypothetical protein
MKSQSKLSLRSQKALKKQWNRQVVRNRSVRDDAEPERKATLMTLPVIAITNESTVLTDDEVRAVLRALQRQCDIDFWASGI